MVPLTDSFSGSFVEAARSGSDRIMAGGQPLSGGPAAPLEARCASPRTVARVAGSAASTKLLPGGGRVRPVALLGVPAIRAYLPSLHPPLAHLPMFIAPQSGEVWESLELARFGGRAGLRDIGCVLGMLECRPLGLCLLCRS